MKRSVYYGLLCALCSVYCAAVWYCIVKYAFDHMRLFSPAPPEENALFALIFVESLVILAGILFAAGILGRKRIPGWGWRDLLILIGMAPLSIVLGFGIFWLAAQIFHW